MPQIGQKIKKVIYMMTSSLINKVLSLDSVSPSYKTKRVYSRLFVIPMVFFL